MSARKSRRSTRKPIVMPKEPLAEPPPNVQLIIQDNLTKFMGRRFPEFCTLRAICLVNGRVSSSATGDARVASYKAAIDSVAKQYYADWPFMVEVLNKWLEMNKDFIRDPIGYAASNPLPPPPPVHREGHSATSTIEETPDRTLTPPAVLNSVPLSPRGDPENFKHPGGLPAVASTNGVALSDLDDPLSSPNDRQSLQVSSPKFFPLVWAGTLHFLPSLWNLGVGALSSVTTRRWFAAPESLARQMSIRWFDSSFLASSYKACLDNFRRSFAPRRRYPTSE